MCRFLHFYCDLAKFAILHSYVRFLVFYTKYIGFAEACNYYWLLIIIYKGSSGFWVGNKLFCFLNSILNLDLSSVGVNLAGCAEMVRLFLPWHSGFGQTYFFKNNVLKQKSVGGSLAICLVACKHCTSAILCAAIYGT